MRILIDEGVSVQIERALVGHVCATVQEAGWGSYTNGALLAKAVGKIELFITADRSLKYQQKLEDRTIAILELSTNRRGIIEGNFEWILQAFNRIKPGDFVSLTLQ